MVNESERDNILAFNEVEIKIITSLIHDEILEMEEVLKTCSESSREFMKEYRDDLRILLDRFY